MYHEGKINNDPFVPGRNYVIPSLSHVGIELLTQRFARFALLGPFCTKLLLTASTCASIGLRQSSVNSICQKHIQVCLFSAFLNVHHIPSVYIA